MNTGLLRTTEEGWISVHDILKIKHHIKSPQVRWHRLKASLGEFIQFKEHQFPGERQRLTPIIHADDIAILESVLPAHLDQKRIRVDSEQTLMGKLLDGKHETRSSMCRA